MTVTSEKGHYYYKASRENYDLESGTCGVYLMANPDEIIQIHFDYIDMPCENNDVVSVSSLAIHLENRTCFIFTIYYTRQI